MGAQREAGVAGLSDAEPVCVGGRVVCGDWGGGVRGVPVRHQEALRAEEARVCAGTDLGGGPVEFVDCGLLGWEGW